jgi:hypothetical protein
VSPTHTKKQTQMGYVCFLTFRFLDGTQEIKNSEGKGSKPNS